MVGVVSFGVGCNSTLEGNLCRNIFRYNHFTKVKKCQECTLVLQKLWIGLRKLYQIRNVIENIILIYLISLTIHWWKFYKKKVYLLPGTTPAVPIFCQPNFWENFDETWILMQIVLKKIWLGEIGKIYRDLNENLRKKFEFKD